MIIGKILLDLAKSSAAGALIETLGAYFNREKSVQGKISMPDGTTPEGHPYGTHYLGANVDLSYYIDPSKHGQHGNLSYRQICCDAPLNDWSCVDTNTSSSSYGTCVTGSESTHIVDIPRTAHFIAKLAGTGRIRVIGTETKVEAALEAEMDSQQVSGLITATERAAGKSVMVTTNDHSSWIWHFNHLHVSFKSDTTVSSIKSFQGPWPNMAPEEQAARMRAFPRRVPVASLPSGHPAQVGKPSTR